MKICNGSGEIQYLVSPTWFSHFLIMSTYKMQLFMHSVLIHCLYGNNQSASVRKEFHTTLSNFNLQSKMFCLNFLNSISNYSKLRVKMAWPHCHVISKRIINCQKVQFLILIFRQELFHVTHLPEQGNTFSG